MARRWRAAEEVPALDFDPQDVTRYVVVRVIAAGVMAGELVNPREVTVRVMPTTRPSTWSAIFLCCALDVSIC
jgi:hypothetical protein